MPVKKNLISYKVSKDYEALYELAKTQSIVCVVDYYGCRDVCQTIYDEITNTLQVSVRGLCYIFSENLEEFLFLCEKLNLEYITPHGN